MIKWVVLLCTALCSSVFAETSADLLQKKLVAIRSMDAKFSQIIRSKKRVLSRSSGVMALTRPSRFRWQTKQPMAQVVVADGAKVWVYDVELEQVTVSKQSKHMGAASALFLSQDNDAVAREFTVVAHQKDTIEIFDLRAKSAKANFEHVRLLFKKNLIVGIELDDQLGQHTLVNFTEIQINHPEPNDLFQFKPPRGVDVVTQ